MSQDTTRLDQLRRSVETFMNDFYKMEDDGLVLATVSETDRKRHDFEFKILRPFLRQTSLYLAQWLPPGERCNHIHNAHGIARCTARVVSASRYCEDHIRHRDNWPTPHVSQAEVDRITREEIEGMKGEVYARSI